MMSEQIPLRANEQVLLRTSFFGGFEKKEVLDYINKLRDQNRTLGKELEDHMLEVAAARNELSSQVSDFQGRVGEMERQLDERGDKIRDLKDMISSLQGEISAGKVARIELDRELNRQKDQNKQLALQAQTYEYKAKRYDEVSQKLGDIMLEANANAKTILEDAGAEAERIKSDAIGASKRITHELVGMRSQLADIRAQIENMITDFSDKVDELDSLLVNVSYCDKERNNDDLSSQNALGGKPVLQSIETAADATESIGKESQPVEAVELKNVETAVSSDSVNLSEKVIAASSFSANQNFFQGAATV